MWKSSGQSITDRLLAAHYTLTGQDLAKSVCKATTDQPAAPKKKHLDYIIYCTNKPNVQISELANVLAHRTHSSSWIVVFKALITTHYILIHGNERFMHYLSSSTYIFELDHFLDRNDAYGFAMSPYIRRYAKYLKKKVCAYRTVVCDFCRVQCGKDISTFATMSNEALLESLALVQDVLDALLQFSCSADDLSNGIIVMAVSLLFRDLIRLFAFYNEGVINLLRRYFDMKKKQCEVALTLYKNFLTRLEWITGFIKVCETTGLNTGGVCELRHVPDSLLDALEQHLSSLNGANPKPQSSRAFDFCLQTRAGSNEVFTPKRTNELSHISRLPSFANKLCKVACKEPECNIKLDMSQKLDVTCDDPMKLIRNPFVSLELLAAKPALSPADVALYYTPVATPSYVPSPFVSDKDFTAAFQPVERCNTTNSTCSTNAVPNNRRENFSNVDHNFSFDSYVSVDSPQTTFQRSPSRWWPQQLPSIKDPSYISIRNKLAPVDT